MSLAKKARLWVALIKFCKNQGGALGVLLGVGSSNTIRAGIKSCMGLLRIEASSMLDCVNPAAFEERIE